MKPIILVSGLLVSFVLLGCEDKPVADAQSEVLSLDQWTYINADSTRQKWGDWDEPKFLRYFGLDFHDVNGDGYKDVVSGRYFYRNPGGDMSGPWARVDLGQNIDGMLFVDVDGDDMADIIGTGLPNVYWIEAKDREGNGWTIKTVAQLKETGHLNGQGYRVAQVVAGGKPEILLSVGDGIWYLEIPDQPETAEWPKTLIAPEAYDEGIAVGDLDGDGDIDIAGGIELPGDSLVAGTRDLHWQNSMVAWWENPGNGSHPWTKHEIGYSTQADRFEIADFNGDGRMDMATSEERYPGDVPNSSVVWFKAPEDPRQGSWEAHTITTAFSLNNLDVADLDEDGDIDVVTNEHKGPDLRTLVYENDGTGQFTEHVIGTGKEAHLGSQLADLDNDGDLDMVSHAWDAYQNLHVWRNDARTGQ